MKKFKLGMVALMLSAGALAGCGNNDQKPDPVPEHVHTFSTEWTSDETNHWHAATCGHDVKDGEGAHTFGNDGKCSVCEYFDESHKFTDEKLGAFKGVFFGGDSVYSISKDGVVIQDGEETFNLQNDTIKGNGYSTVVTYKGPGDSSVTLKWKRAAWDANNLSLMLPTFVVGEEETQVQPSVEAAQGWYDGWDGEMSPGLQIYIVSNEFDGELDAFNLYTANFSYQYIALGGYLRSSFVKIGENIELALSWFDGEEIEAGFNVDWENYYLFKDEESGRLIMADINPEDVYPEWWTRPSFFMGDEFIEPSSLDYSLGSIFGDWMYDSYSFSFDEDAKTVSINWGDDLEYVEGYDEKGAYVLIDGAKYRGTNYGISVETAEGVEECPYFVFDDYSNLQWYSYLSGASSIAFVLDTNWDTWETEGYLEIDGVKADESYLTFVDNMVAIGATVGEDEYVMLPYDGVDAVLVGKNNVPSIYIESSKSSEFIGKYFLPSFSPVSVYEKEDTLYVKYAEEDFEASLAYDLTYGIVVTFGYGFEIAMIDPDVGVYALFAGNDAFYLFTQSSVMAALGEWTCGPVDITFNNNMTVDFVGGPYDMLGLTVLKSSLGTIMPACVFGKDTTQLYALIDPVNTAVYQATATGLQYFASFVRPETFDTFFGEYNYAGEFGTERIYLKGDYSLIVTTLNEEKTGIVDLEYNYDPFAYFDDYGDFRAGLTFYSDDIPVSIYYDGEGHCSIFDIVYLAKAFFDNQGLYGSSADSNLYVVDNKVVYNGEKMVITALGSDSISGTFDGKDATITFAEGNATVSVDGEEPVVLAKNAAQVSSFACEVKENVGNLNEDIQVTSDGKILIRDTGDEGAWTQVTDYAFVIDADGNVSIEFEWKVAYKFTIEKVEGNIVISGESSVPPLPPIPPMPF